MLSPGSLVCALGRQADAPMDGRPSFDEVPPQMQVRQLLCKCARKLRACGSRRHPAGSSIGTMRLGEPCRQSSLCQ